MAAKRLYEGDDQKENQDQQGGKRLKKLPSFSTVIRDVIMAKSLQNFCLALEPLLRQVVKEEMERKLAQGALMLPRSPQRQIQEEFSSLKLIFKKQLNLPIYTFSKIDDEEGDHLQIQIIDTLTGETPVAFYRLSNLKVEIVAVNGDFPGDREEWMATEFNNNIMREREGRRPLLLGDVSVTLRDGVAYITNLSFTDNSSWIRSRHFRIGARVVPDSYDGPRILEALTERFTVKDQRGELYKKHYPPALGDDVWRLDRIGKGGAFHQKLGAERIETVQDFLKLLVIDPDHLRVMLSSMSDKMWEGTINHARTCPIGSKRYLFNDPYYGNTVFLNSICEVVGVILHGNLYTTDQLPIQQRAYVQSLAKQAYYNWDKLEETEFSLPANALLPIELPAPQGLMASSSWHAANQEITTVTEFQIEGPNESQLFEAAFSLDCFGSKTHPD
ncbi:CALMODULIN-BINDING PROTEIN60 [Dioscorea alata]|uniref:CALMODULIN-BINDING PROTEIN60 n=1 Tax=Dioscorea alata TaxID=55571 RepID=A0ACB7W4G9_DIOAL|nr:CALMODULIN-BINDING PROTEIN60 [Dioscorea alata]